MNVETIEDLFLRELLRAYSIESELVDVLATLEADADVDALDNLGQAAPREALTAAISDHRSQTETHVERLEDAFESLDRQAEVRSTPTLDGLVKEKERFNNVVLNDEVRPVYYLGVAEDVETLEISLYQRLLRLVDHLDVPDEVTTVLEENLEDDVQTRDELQALADDDDVSQLIDAVIEATDYE